MSGTGMQLWKPYPAYKDSGVESLGQVPEGWEIKRLKFCVANGFQYGANIAAELNDTSFPRYIRITDMRDDGTLKDDTFRSLLPEDALPYLLCDKDILLARSGATVGKSFIYSKDMGAAAYAGYLIRISALEGVLPQFLYAFLNSGSYWQWVNSIFIQATIQNISAEKYACLQVTVPSFSEQQAIAAFLDYECARIDALIEKKRRLLELFEEKRRAVIAQAVTRGLDLNVPTKDSGVEWGKQVPQYWQLVPFSKYLSEQSDYRGKTPTKTLSGIFLVTAKNVRMGYIDYETSQEFISEDEYDEVMRRGLPQIGDILFTTEAPLGNIAQVDREDIALAQRIIRFRMDSDNFDMRFIFYMMMSSFFQVQIKSLATGSTAEGLKASKLSILKVLRPPLPEQQAIADYLDAATAAIDSQRQAHEKSIALLQEYRASLITHAVTGKIDVREYAPQQ